MTLLSILSTPFMMTLLTQGSKTAINAILGSNIAQGTGVSLPGCTRSVLNDIQLCDVATFEEEIDLLFGDITFGVGLKRVQGLGSFRVTDISYTADAGERFVRGDNQLSVSISVVAEEEVSASIEVNPVVGTFSVGVDNVGATVAATLAVDCDRKGVILTVDEVSLDDIDWFDARELADDICLGIGFCRDAIDGPLGDLNDLLTDGLNGAVELIIEEILPENNKILPLLICPN